jgi:hypothetical protein
MGLITELLENDKDGTLRKNMFRTVHIVGYVLVLGLVVFLAGLSWRMFNGSEVEIFGVRVASPNQTETTPTIAQPVTPAPGNPPVSGVVASAKVEPLSPAEHLRRTFYRNAWIAMPGDLEICTQTALDITTRLGVVDPSRADQIVRGQLRKDQGEVHVRIRCMPMNGFSIAYIAGISTSDPLSTEFVEAARLAFLERTGSAPSERVAGTIAKQEERYSWMLTRFETVKACTDFADLAISRQKPSTKTYDGPGVFAVIDGTRATILCIQQNNLITAIVAVNGFWRDDVHRVRDALVKELTPMQRR